MYLIGGRFGEDTMDGVPKNKTECFVTFLSRERVFESKFRMHEMCGSSLVKSFNTCST